MITPSRWQELTAVILDRFQGIRIAEDYQTNLGLSLAEWRMSPLGPDEDMALSVRTFPASLADEDTFGEHRHRLRVRCDIVVAGEDAAAKLRACFADLTKAIGADLTWGDLAVQTLPSELSEPTIEQGDRKVMGLSVEFVVLYVTERWSAYA